MRTHRQNGWAGARAGFALAEVVMLVLVAGVAIAVLLVAGAKTRSAAGLNRDLGDLRLFGQWTSMYAADFEDRTWTLTAAPDSKWPVLRPLPGAGQEIANGAKHAIDIIRRRTGREDFPLPGAWIAHVLYSHLALADYADVPLPDRRLVATGDVHRMNWTDDPVNKHDQGFWQPFQQPTGGGIPGNNDKRWPYSSSYMLGPAWYDTGQSDWTSGYSRLYPASVHSYGTAFGPLGLELRGRALSLTAFPSQKVMIHDYGDWYHTRDPRLFLHQDPATGETARVAMLMADGAAGVRATADSNPGWDPRQPTSSGSTAPFVYSPRSWEPPTLNGQSGEIIREGVYRWTRGGTLGRDFGGSEIDTGQR